MNPNNTSWWFVQKWMLGQNEEEEESLGEPRTSLDRRERIEYAAVHVLEDKFIISSGKNQTLAAAKPRGC